MAIALDASSPASVLSGNNLSSATTASFTPPVGSRLVVGVGDCSTGGTITFTPSESQGILTWTRLATNATEACELWISSQVGTSVSRTVTVSRATGTNQFGIVVQVWTGTSGAGATDNGSTSATNNVTPTVITTTADNSQVISFDIEDNNLGLISSTDSIVTVAHGGAGDFALVYKASVTATSGTAVTMNFDATGTGAAAHRWCTIELLDSGGGGGATYVPPTIIVPTVAAQRASRW